MGARYYDPVIGRFISTDPQQFDEENPHLFNRYAYANNNPYRYIDPNGQFAVPVEVGLGAAILVGTAIYISNPEFRKRMDRAAQALSRGLGNIYNEAKLNRPGIPGDSIS